MRKPVVLDLETQHTFREFAEHKKLRISTVAVYDYGTDTMKSFLESQLADLYKILENASMLIGFNIVNFDLPVLQAYYPGDVTQFKTFDILDDIKEKLGHRLALDDVVRATLGKKKSGHGLAAIELYKEGKIKELQQYCEDDVTLTRQLFDFGVENGEIYYMDHMGKATIKVDWKRVFAEKEKNDISLTLPF
ncbi:hypothetical protein A2799_01765 [Candidatus Roizmanbacteria bacterium RIFCSPHIGHO2_01_FULL_39_24]|uniref:YprB ribonuclease H-like domain-containing protein n=1 Tax=Candidatus Roizmanbacteria bacterium RIFCSPHIGHO2_01_FULL_39_24 TaxID=1802032 RepID=A0A1F7GFR8_9BACT|nr:MAG: hypothetical protein A2799_01765 [Candidatus Roizmanbacteria bacterium RIFCSPHIGHO2_01_FULL_39_24]